MGAAGGAGSLTLVAPTECAWAVASDVNWITFVSPLSGQGPTEIRFQVSPNPAASARQGRITVNGFGTPVNQAGVSCTVELSPPSQSVEASGGGGTIQVTTPGGCAWTTSTSAPWLTVTAGASGTGNGSVSYTVSANTGGARLGALTIGDQSFQVLQAAPGAAQCNYSIQQSSVNAPTSGGSFVVDVQSDPSCSWAAASNVAWIAVTGVGVGTGNGSVTVVVAPNTGAARSGTVTIAGRMFTVNQEVSCAGLLNPSSANVTAGGGPGPSIAVTVVPGCTWTASTSDSWLTITQGAAGTGSGTVTFSATSNPGPSRTGSLAIAGQTFGVTQPSCAGSLNPTFATVPAGGGPGPSIAVLVVPGCAWTASTTDSWLTITQGAGGNGNGTVGFSAATNLGPSRTGSLAIAGQTFGVTQPSCQLSLNLPSQSLPVTAGAGSPITVSAVGGCGWTATPSESWITITGGASGVGNGSVTFSVTANSGSARTGTITIGGQVHTVTQAGSCAISIAPPSQTVPAAGGTAASVTVTAAVGCNWTAVPSQSWLTVTSGASGSGNGSVGLSAAANNGPDRSATVTIAGAIHMVSQTSGCTYSLNPTSHALDMTAQTPPAIAVNTTSGCFWTASSNDSWIIVQSGASGVGPGTVTYRVTANPGTAPRTGTLTIAGRTFTVVQDNHEPF